MVIYDLQVTIVIVMAFFSNILTKVYALIFF